MTSSTEFSPAQTPCPHCGQQHPVGATSCPVTGQPLSQNHVTCKNCGSVIETDWVRCPQCGVEVRLPSAPLPIAQPLSQPHKKTRWWLWLLLAGGVMVVGIIIIGGYFLVKNPRVENIIAGLASGQTQTPGSSVLPTSTSLPGQIQNSETPQAAPLTETPAPTQQPASTNTVTSTPPSDPTATMTFTPTPAEGPWEACSNTYLSRLRVGDLAFVALDPPLANRVRERPNTTSAILGNIEPGEEIEILGGPACNTRWVWWEVRSLEKDLQGWTAEGDGVDYWLVPKEE